MVREPDAAAHLAYKLPPAMRASRVSFAVALTAS
jgi:hypothetical protein